MNTIHIYGNLGADPETRVTPNGHKLTVLRVASNSRRSGKEETMWWRVVIWGTEMDKFISLLKRGSSVMIVGTMMKPEIYTDKEGNPQVSLQMTASMINFPPFGRDRGQEEGQNYNQTNMATATSQAGYGQTSANKYNSGYRQSDSFAEPEAASASYTHAMTNQDEEMPF